MKCVRHTMLACLLAFLAGCHPQGTVDKRAAEQAYTAVRDRFFQQEGYSFHGRTKMVSGDTANGNLVNFSGQVRGKDVLLHVKLSFPDDKRIDTMSLLSQNQKLYARLQEDKGWQAVAKGDVGLEQEFLNWSPIFSFQQMEEMRSAVMPVRDPVPGDDLAAVRVLLDGSRLKSWLAKQMKDQVGGRIPSEHVPKLKMALSLSNDREWRDVVTGAQVQAAETRREIDDMIERMELEAEYTVYYDRTHMLPRKLVLNVRSTYNMNGQRVHEHSEVETFLQNYGTRYALPNPALPPAQPTPARTTKR